MIYYIGWRYKGLFQEWRIRKNINSHNITIKDDVIIINYIITRKEYIIFGKVKTYNVTMYINKNEFKAFGVVKDNEQLEKEKSTKYNIMEDMTK